MLWDAWNVLSLLVIETVSDGFIFIWQVFVAFILMEMQYLLVLVFIYLLFCIFVHL